MNLAQLRAHAVSWTFCSSPSLKATLRRLGFVQADPIRAPARAQDLILRQRVAGYRAGDLERRYASLDLEEDLLYAYGFVPRTVSQLLHPRRADRMTALEKRVLQFVHASGETHPADLEAQFGKKRVVNAWGGFSKATKHALERLHHRGLLRIARRENGIRVYEPVQPPGEPLAPQDRLRALLDVVANLLAPVQESTLRTIGHYLARRIHGAGRPSLPERRETIDGVSYILAGEPGDVEERVRILAPFDPLVWDRKRFEHLFGWSYRFEAYTPVKKRVRGYYAMPLLWRDRVIGWVNWSEQPEIGFVDKRPTERAFVRELEAELERFRQFL